MKKYLIIGNGVAGTTAAEYIRKQDNEGQITIISDETIPFYYRTRLADYIAGEISEDKLIARKEHWYKNKEINLMISTRITGGNLDENFVNIGTGEKIHYDSLLLATGSNSFIPPIEGVKKEGVFTLRSICDANAIVSAAELTDTVVIIGGGLLGLEAGNALRKLGKKVSIVEFFPRLLPRQLDEAGADTLQHLLEEMGFTFRLGVSTSKISSVCSETAVELDNGETLHAGIVIISAGIRPDLSLSQKLGIKADKGVLVDNQMLTSHNNVYAAGDVAQYKNFLYGIWPAAMEQGIIAGINMGGGKAFYSGSAMATTLKVAGLDVASAGNIDNENRLESRLESTDRTYRKYVLDNEIVVGCIMVGDTKGFSQAKKAISEHKRISDVDI